tara:strand:- start:742 stop:1047 length:306 start_codon:yes stop_codon:yes gene_type:complete
LRWKALEITDTHAHTESQLRLARHSPALDEWPQKANFRADSMVHIDIATEVPLISAHTEKFIMHAKPVKVFISFAHVITKIDMVDTESFVVNTKHISAMAQ